MNAIMLYEGEAEVKYYFTVRDAHIEEIYKIMVLFSGHEDFFVIVYTTVIVYSFICL